MPTGKFICYLKGKKMITKGCISHLVWVTDTDAKAPTLWSMLVVSEYLKVFLDELPRIPPDRVTDFSINVLPETKPISIPSYRMP